MQITQSLAQAVIRQAVIDYLIPAHEKERTPDCYETAESFLFKRFQSRHLRSWCQYAGFKVRPLRQIIREYKTMPWNPIDAPTYTHRADTHKKRQLWSKIANEVLKKTGDDARAIKEANAAIHRVKE